MVAGMTPVLQEGRYLFCSTGDATRIEQCRERAIGMFREAEGVSFILAAADAEAIGFDGALPMRHIVLQIVSALDGVGLTAAVSAALAERGIPCNMVAAYHHDHVFVPDTMADEAVAVLRELQAGVGRDEPV